jgi:hypothetical protein
MASMIQIQPRYTNCSDGVLHPRSSRSLLTAIRTDVLFNNSSIVDKRAGRAEERFQRLPGFYSQVIIDDIPGILGQPPIPGKLGSFASADWLHKMNLLKRFTPSRQHTTAFRTNERFSWAEAADDA